MALAPPERAKLIGILGMLGSDHDGERASAALLATRMVRDRGLQWNDLIGGSAEAPRQHEERPIGWRSDLALCRRHSSLLSAWEQTFIGSLARRTTISVKQRAILTGMADALRARGMS